MWSRLGKDGLAVKAFWPKATEEDKLLTRQAKFLRDSLKRFRGQAGKAKKGWKAASVVVGDVYPKWKIDTLQWMQGQYSAESGFPSTFMKDLKDWTSVNVPDKKMMKLVMQFASFMKNEALEVGDVAMDISLPFDQASIFENNIIYLKAQLNILDMDIVKLESVEGIPDKISEQVTPGNPYLWMR